MAENLDPKAERLTKARQAIRNLRGDHVWLDDLLAMVDAPDDEVVLLRGALASAQALHAYEHAALVSVNDKYQQLVTLPSEVEMLKGQRQATVGTLVEALVRASTGDLNFAGLVDIVADLVTDLKED